MKRCKHLAPVLITPRMIRNSQLVVEDISGRIPRCRKLDVALLELRHR